MPATDTSEQEFYSNMIAQSPVWCRLLVAFVALVASVGLVAPPAQAELIAQVESLSIISDPVIPLTFGVDVFIDHDLVTLPELAAYNLTASLSPASAGVEFLQAVEATNHPPIFAGQDPLDLVTGGTMIDAADDVALGGEVPISDGAGLLRLEFQVQPGTAGDFQITLDQLLLFDGLAGSIPVTGTVPGTLSIIVPEPATESLLLLGIAVCLTLCAFRRAARVECQ